MFWKSFLFHFDKNSEGRFAFCLNSIESFGMLREMSKDEIILKE
jgi:hypothetical protein